MQTHTIQLLNSIDLSKEKYILLSNCDIVGKLEFDERFKKFSTLDCSKNSIEILVIPQNIHNLNYSFNPLKKLIFNAASFYNDELNNLPNELIMLTLGNLFDRSIDLLPTNLQQLIFTECSRFNRSVDNLPNSLCHLHFGLEFNQTLDNLPNSLCHLTVSYHMNRSINNLPCNLVFLDLGYHFNQSICNLPQKLIWLKFSRCFNSNINMNILPNNLKILIFGNKKVSFLLNKLPNNLTHLLFEHSSEFNMPLNNLPNNLTHLSLGYCYSCELKNLPPSLKYVQISEKAEINICNRSNTQILFYSNYYDFMNFYFKMIGELAIRYDCV